MLWLLFACARAPDAPDPNSPAALLATRTGAIGRDAAALAVELQDMEGLFDAVRTAAPEERTRLIDEIRRRAAAAKVESVKLRSAVADIEAGAQVY